MNWPGMGDPTKRKKTLKFLAFTASVGAVAVLITALVLNPMIAQQAHNACIDDIETRWSISFTYEMWVDGIKAEFSDIGKMLDCQRAIYEPIKNGTVYAEWTEDPNFEIGHWLYISDPNKEIRDFVEDKHKVTVDGKISPQGLKHPLIDGAHYKLEFTSHDYDTSKDADFMPPEL
jgi:hypothetical protein